MKTIQTIQLTKQELDLALQDQETSAQQFSTSNVSLLILLETFTLITILIYILYLVLNLKKISEKQFEKKNLFHVREYVGNPFLKHASMPLEQHHFERWLNLFIDNDFEGEIAKDVKFRAMIIANTFHRRISDLPLNFQNQ